MAISIPTKIGILTLGLLVLGSAVYSKLEDAKTKFFFKVYFSRVHSIRNGSLNLIYKAEIKNLSGFNVPLKNVFILIQFSKDKGMNWSNIAASDKRIVELLLKDNTTTSQDFPLEFHIADTLNSILAKRNKYRMVLNYEVLGQPGRFITSYDFTSTLAKIPGLKGLQGAATNQLQLL